MKKNLIIISLIFAVPILAYWGLTRSNSSTAKNVEPTKPQVIKFASDMCLDCQKMAKVFRELKPMYQSKFIFTDLNVQDRNSYTENMVKKYKVTLVPTIVLIGTDGKVVERLEGAYSKEQMEGFFKELK